MLRKEHAMTWFHQSTPRPILVLAMAAVFVLAASVHAQNQPQPKSSIQGAPGQPADSLSTLEDLVLGSFFAPNDELLGATLQPVGEALRAQLGLAAGQGLLVASVRGDGPSAQAGLQPNDVLLSLGDKPLAAAADLTLHLKAAGEAAVPLKILRMGKPLTLQVRPIYRVTLGPAAEHKTEYYLGISLDTADPALRAQLELPAGQGVVVKEVASGSPAEKAGVKKHDILLELNGKPVDSPETLTRQVQVAQDKPATLTLLRAGKRLTIQVTAAARKVQVSPDQESVRFWMVPQYRSWNRVYAARVLQPEWSKAGAPAGNDELRQRLDNLEKELKAVRSTLDKINETLKMRNRD
jgi:C-terminal processing protease CtpA/Prc